MFPTTSSSPASALGSRPELGRFGSQDQMLFEDLVIAIVVVNGDDCDGDCTKDDEDNNGWWQKPCNSDPDVHSLAPVPRQLLKFLSARVDCDKADADEEYDEGWQTSLLWVNFNDREEEIPTWVYWSPPSRPLCCSSSIASHADGDLYEHHRHNNRHNCHQNHKMDVTNGNSP